MAKVKAKDFQETGYWGRDFNNKTSKMKTFNLAAFMTYIFTAKIYTQTIVTYIECLGLLWDKS